MNIPTNNEKTEEATGGSEKTATGQASQPPPTTSSSKASNSNAQVYSANNFDFLDAVVDLEGTAFQQGREVGVAAADRGDMWQQGRQGGFNRAYALALELGFLEASESYAGDGLEVAVAVEETAGSMSGTDIHHLTAALDLSPAIGNSSSNAANGAQADAGRTEEHAQQVGDLDDSSGGPPKLFLTKRAHKRKLAILAKLALIPNSNQASVDYDKELLELRAMYRLNGSRNGRFLPATVTTPDHAGNAAAAGGGAGAGSRDDSIAPMVSQAW